MSAVLGRLLRRVDELLPVHSHGALNARLRRDPLGVSVDALGQLRPAQRRKVRALARTLHRELERQPPLFAWEG